MKKLIFLSGIFLLISLVSNPLELHAQEEVVQREITSFEVGYDVLNNEITVIIKTDDDLVNISPVIVMLTGRNDHNSSIRFDAIFELNPDGNTFRYHFRPPTQEVLPAGEYYVIVFTNQSDPYLRGVKVVLLKI